MWLLYFVNGFNQSITGNLAPYITSEFEAHSLVPLIQVVSSIMGAATYMPLAKILNLWDRSVGFALMAGFATLGLILAASCKGIGVYCASQVFYSIGFTGMIFAIDVITADTSTLRDRGLAYAFTSSPYIITAYAGPTAAARFYENNWRWAYGSFAIILPVFAAPLVLIMRYARKQAEIKGLLPAAPPASNRTFIESVKHYTIEFDGKLLISIVRLVSHAQQANSSLLVLGTFLLLAGLVLTLIPFNLAGSSANGWAQDYIIAMLVLGIVCIIAFGLNEKFLAPVPFLQWDILKSRTVMGACALDVCYQISYYCWLSYYTSFLQVNSGQSLQVAGYISSIFDVVSGVWLFVVGFAIKRTSRFRWILYWAVPLYMLGQGLMIYFRKPDQEVGYLIMCQIFLAFAGGAMIIVQQVAVLAASDHQNAAGSLAFLGVFGNIGGSVGGSVSGAIWQGTLPGALQRFLPAESLPDWESIYEDLDLQLSYPKGTETRLAIEKAYSLAQQHMVICGTAVMALSLIWMFVIKDIKLDRKQTKGVLF